MQFVRSVVISVAVLPIIASLTPAQSGGRNLSPEEREQRRAQQEQELQEELQAKRPIPALDSVWIEELTWMEVRDAIAAGKSTAIISTGGIEQNGPYVATGKHNYVLKAMCEAIARELGNALCAPIIKLVPEGNIDRPSGHMRYPGTLSLRAETFQAVLVDVGQSLLAHGFENLIYIGDSGGNQRGMAAAAKVINEKAGKSVAHHVQEFYDYAAVSEYMNAELGVVETANDGLHDNFYITSIMMAVDPTVVRYEQRVSVDKATINGLSIAPKEATIEVGKKLIKYRSALTVKAIKAALGSG